MKKLLYIGALACLFAACKPQTGDAVLHLGVGFEAGKAAMSADELLSSARVNIYYADYSGLVKSYRYGEMPESVYLPASTYRIDVAAGESIREQPRRANWEQAAYKGSETVSLAGGTSTTVQVNAKVSSAVVKVLFDKTVSGNLKDYTLTIGPDAEHVLVFDASKAGSRGFFLVSDLEDPVLHWTFSGKKAKSGAKVEKSGEIKAVEGGRQYELSLRYTVREGYANFDIYVDESVKVVDDIIVFEPVSSGLAPSASYEIWAAHATVHADVDEGEYSDPSAIRFEYSKDGSQWTGVAAQRKAEGKYEARLTGLQPATSYVYRLSIGGEQIGSTMSFKTEAAPQVPNGSFEETSNSSSGKYTEFYNPSASDPVNRTAWWGSGNGSEGISGSADMGYVLCKSDDTDKVDGKKSACLQSNWAIVKFAAGNLFSGYFGGLVGTKGAIVYFGRPFTARPTALKVWAKYSTGKINHIDGMPSGVTVTTSNYDKARLEIALGNWSPKQYGGNKNCPILINTTVASTMVSFGNTPETVAHAVLELAGNASNTTNTWKEYTLRLNYRDETVLPQYIVLSFASSYLGDYFTGCDSSRLWVDKCTFVYE
ncbi:MAG: DUF4493 domain-containing protein [Bacteroidales bacterium]|nr:DUF4493 domain-containing protein [Bacteroidales bacterium]